MELGNKKGIFYLFISLIFLLSVTMLFFSMNAYDYRDSQEPITSRIRTSDDFINDLNNDAKKATWIATYRALIAMEEEIATTGTFFADAEVIFQEAFFNGTVSGKNKTILNASSFSDYLNRVRITANDIGLALDIVVTNVSLYHTDPWHVSVRVNFTNNVTDQRGIASWYYEKQQETKVPIFDLRDPLYSVGTLGRVPNTIRVSNMTFLINDTNNANDTTNLIAHANDSFYISNELAPSYVMRLEGNLSNSTYGIESLVNTQKLQAQGLTIDSTQTIVDYLYFGTNVTVEVCHTLMNSPSWIRIDRVHINTYEVDPKLDPEDIGYFCD